jgi:hypothetical protein
MMETIFGKFSDGAVKVELKKTIGRGDDVCHFIVHNCGGSGKRSNCCLKE